MEIRALYSFSRSCLACKPKVIFFDDNKGILEAIIDLGMKIKMNGWEITQDISKGRVEYLRVLIRYLKEEGQISVVKGVI